MNAFNPIAVFNLDDAQPHELLSAFVEKFNAMAQYTEELEQTIEQLEQCQRLRDDILADEKAKVAGLQAIIEQQDHDLAVAAKGIADAQTLANTTKNQQVQLNHLQAQLASAQQMITQAKQATKQLQTTKEQVKRLKDSAEKYQLRCKKQEHEKAELKKEAAFYKERWLTTQDKVIELTHQLNFKGNTGIYHGEKEHLFYWPEVTKLKDEQGNEFTSRCLLMMHESGRGGFIAMSPDGNVGLMDAPKGGLRASKDTLAFAKDWLFKVNELQNGVVYEADLIAPNP
jgi:myosin heavy subunit